MTWDCLLLHDDTNFKHWVGQIEQSPPSRFGVDCQSVSLHLDLSLEVPESTADPRPGLPQPHLGPTGLQGRFHLDLLPSHLPVGLPFNFWLWNCLPGASDVLPVHGIYFSTTWAWCFCAPGHRCLDGRTHADESRFHHWLNKKLVFSSLLFWTCRP